MTLVGATVASVWGDIFHHPDDEAVLDDTLACVCRMYSEWDGLSGWAGSRKVRPGICNRSGMEFPNGATSGNCIHSEREFWDTVSRRYELRATWGSRRGMNKGV